MSQTKDNWTVGLVHELCPICRSHFNQQIIIPRKLTSATKKEIEDMNNKAIGFADEPCEKCKEHLDKGYYALVGIDPSQSDTKQMETIYYTGSVVWMKQHATKQLFGEEIIKNNLLLDSFMFVEDEINEQIKSSVSQ